MRPLLTRAHTIPAPVPRSRRPALPYPYPAAAPPQTNPGGSGALTDTIPHQHTRSPATAIPSSTPQPTQTSTSIPAATPTQTPMPRKTATAVPTPVIMAPVNLGEAELGGSKLYARYWTNTKAIIFSMGAAPGTTPGMRPEVELEPLSRPYTGKPTASGAPLTPDAPGTITIAVSNVPEGAYHWQARLSDGQGHNGPWVDFYNGPAFRLDRTPPQAPVISSSTHPDQNVTYGADMAKLSWTAAKDNGAIDGYQTGVDRNPHGVPSGPISAVRSTVIGPLANGNIYFHVRALDYAGNYGATATYLLRIDHAPPTLAKVVFDRFQFNPQFDKLTVHFVPDKNVKLRVVIAQQQTKGTVAIINAGMASAGKEATVKWNGRDYHGALVPAGLYTMVIYATDHLGNVGDGYFTDLTVSYKYIVVHLGTQSMDMYDNNTLVQSTLITSGNKVLPTPVGVWHIGAKFHPYTFISPDKKGSLYYYPPSPVNYAMYFHAGGYFIHDAPWRTAYGPGTNTGIGVPGQNYTGTHGCVNVPLTVMQWLYNWAPIGTVVDVVPN